MDEVEEKHRTWCLISASLVSICGRGTVLGLPNFAAASEANFQAR